MMARGSGIREGRNMDPDKPDQSGSVGQDSKGIMHGRSGQQGDYACLGRQDSGNRAWGFVRGSMGPRKGRHIGDGAGGSPEGAIA